MADPIRHVRGHLRRSEPVAALLDEVERRERMLATIRGAVPTALARHCRQVSLDAERLTLFVDSPAWVDRLRFLSPQIVDALNPDGTTPGVVIRECRVRVLPGYLVGADLHPSVASRRRGPSSEVAADCLEQAAASLGDSPLATSLRRLARNFRVD